MTKIIIKMFRKLCTSVPLCLFSRVLRAFSRSSFVPLRLCASVPSSNSGIALIMVLGLLTVMVLMAVTFAISMRTERLAAGNYADTVRARELTHVALARAMDDINALIQMHSCFVIDELGKIVIVRPNHDFQVGDEVRVFSPSNLPSGPIGGGLVTDFIYKVSYIDQGEYIIRLVSNSITLNITDDGKFNDRVIPYDSLPGPFGPSAVISGMRSYTLGTPIRIQSVGNLTQYVIPIDDLHIKWATSYRNALKGEANPLMTYTIPDIIELQPLHGIYPVVTNKWVSGDQLVYYSDRERLRTGMAVRLEPPVPSDSLPVPLSAASVYYIRCVSNQVNTNASPVETNRFIQLCDSYTNAVANRPISITYAFNDKVIIIPIQSVASSNLALVSYSTNQAHALSDFSELVRIDSVLDTVQVKNNYHSGETVAFTTINTLPVPLKEKTPYYVIAVSPEVIQLAASIDNALSIPPIKIDMASSWGNHRMYKLGLSGEATNYIPTAVYTKAEEVLAAASSNVFVGIYASTNGELMGKVRYAIVDCSGLLDANYVGGEAREYSTNPKEFQLANLPESPVSLPGNRTSYRRYETLYELAQNMGYHPNNLFVYSYSQPEQWDPYLMNLQTPINIGGNVVQLQSQISAITNGLRLAGFTNSVEAGVIYSNLIDYVDDDLIPLNQEYCVENVPMINEVAACCHAKKDDLGGGQFKYTIEYFLTNEFWYPFASNAPFGFTNMSTATFTLPEDSDLKPADLGFFIANIGAPSAESFVCLPRQAMKETIKPNNYNTLTLSATIWLSNSVNDASGNKIIVDQTIAPITLTHVIDFSSGNDKYVHAGFECRDPRYNLNPADPNQWRQATFITLGITGQGEKNQWVTEYFASTPDSDNDTSMYVGNRPLKSAAELGYLLYSTNAPWKTVKLYGPNRHRVLDVFAIAKDTSDWFAHTIYNHGQINPNTKSMDVMKSWFQGMSVDKYPGQTVGASTLGLSDADTIARLIVDHAGSYTNLSDLGRVLTTFPLVPVSGPSELEKESYFRNAFGLFNIHQNVFTILIEAKAASGGNIPKNPARQRAVAIVWRDPYTGEMFIRHIKWLGD